jgi:outer membrane receptor protein involved in Fe transport
MAVAFLLSLSLALQAITGIVRDTSGGAVPGALVILAAESGGEQRTLTGPDGRFAFDTAPDGGATIVVRAGGFAEIRQRWVPGEIEIVLSPAAVLEAVTVTPTRTEQRLGDTPASVTVLTSERIRQSPAVVADDVLRQIPTFSLFRRTSSLSSHPTAQGVSLRGIGPSGVSRTLVLIDNVPFNDPFGGWVYWTRVPLDNVDRIEVVDGPTSSLYGNYAMGGVINIVSGRARRRTIEIKPQFGNRDSRKLDLTASDVWGRLGARVSGSLFDTDGFPVVALGERGPVDTKAKVQFRNVNIKVDYSPIDRVSAFVRGGYFREERDNGKVTIGLSLPSANGLPEANHTTWKSVNGGVRIVLPDQSTLEAGVFGDFERFHSNFLAVPNLTTRAIGRRSLDQQVPTTNLGGMAQWSRAFGARHYFSAGTDWRWVDGDSEEDAFDTQTGTNQTLRRVSGGTQRSLGFFAQDIFTPMSDLTVTASARVDHWRNYHAHNLEYTVAAGVLGLPAAGHKPSLPDTEETVGSPRVAALYRVTDRVNAWGSVSWGFRTPTLNELYRQFRVGALLTLANENLGSERLVGGEAGVSVAVTSDVTARATWFDNRVKNPISNVTIGTNLQQRQNLGRTRIAGLQTDVEYRLGSELRVGGAYVFNQAKVREFAANPALVNNCRGIAGEACFLAQVPEHRGSLQATYSNPRYASLSFGLTFIGRQFDDDQNLRGVPSEGCTPNSTSCTNPGLPGYALVDFTASRGVGRNVEIFFGVQNIGDVVYFVGTNPTTIGSPRLLNVGVRVRFSGR